MHVVCIAHTGATRENNPWRPRGLLGLGFPRETACMVMEEAQAQAHMQAHQRVDLGQP